MAVRPLLSPTRGAETQRAGSSPSGTRASSAVMHHIRRSGHAHRVLQFALRVVGRVRDLGHLVPMPSRAAPVDSLIVSVTSFPTRISRVAMTIESIQRQSILPERIVLVLADDQFPGRRLPWLLRLQLVRPNVELLWVGQDTRSYKKLVPVRRRYPDATVVTVDDDVIYRRSFLAELVTASRDVPDAVVGHRGWELRVVDGRLEPYAIAAPAGPDSRHERVLLTGVGGILYPPLSLPLEVVLDRAALTVCPTADDIWFWAAARVAGTRTICIGNGRPPFRAITSLKFSSSLQQVNNGGGGNDRQLAAAVRHFALQTMLGLSSTEPSTGSGRHPLRSLPPGQPGSSTQHQPSPRAAPTITAQASGASAPRPTYATGQHMENSHLARAVRRGPVDEPTSGAGRRP